MSEPSTPEQATPGESGPGGTGAAVPVPPAASPARTTARTHARRVLSAYTGEHGIYGVVLVTALLAIGEHYDTDLEVLLYVSGTMVVFWLAHVYAGVVAAGGDPDRRGDRLRTKLAHSARHSVGMLVAMLPPLVLLALGTLGVLTEDDAYDYALITGVVVLAVIGWLNAARNGRPWYVRLGGAAATATLGILIMTLSALAH